MVDDKRATRRRYSAEFKAQVLAECDVPGASVAKVAMTHGINDNLVHGWRKLARESGTATPPRPSEFVPVTVTAAPMHSADTRGIEVELRRGAVTMKITWPLSAAVDFAAWMRELLR
jgi:transposase